MSVSEKVAEYIKSHPQWKGKPLDKVILAMYSKGELSSEEVKRVLGSNIFDDDISDTEAQEALNTTLFYGNSNTDAIGDNIVLHGQSSLEREETSENTSAPLQAPAAAETSVQTTAQSTAGTTAKAAGGAKTAAETISEGTSASENSSSEEKTLSEIFTERMNNTSTSLQAAEESNGFIGKAWSGIKNFFGFGASSNKVREVQETESELISQLDGENASEAFKELTGVDYTDENIEKFKTGEVKLKSEEALEGYKEGQDMAADIAGDLVSGISAVMVYTMAIAAAPVTGGASIALGFGLAGTTGALVKSGVKALDAASGGREYDSLEHDMITGAFSGMLAPLTGGMGGVVGKTVAAKMGTQVIKEVGKEAAKETAKSAVKSTSKSGVKQFFKTALTNPTGFTYKGSTLGKLTAYAAESAVDGTVGGGVDMSFRTAIDGGSAEEVLSAGVQGAAGGLFMGPLMNLGFRGAGKAGKKILNFFGIKTKVKAETGSTSSKGADDAASGTNTAERTSKKGGTNETSGVKDSAETNTARESGINETNEAASPKKGGTGDNMAEAQQVKPEAESKVKPDETPEAPKPSKAVDSAPAVRRETTETAKPAKSADPETPKKADESVEAPKPAEVKVDIETVKKEAAERGITDIEITEENAEVMHKILAMTKNPDGTGEYRFNANQITQLSKLNKNLVDKAITMTKNPDGSGGYRFNTYDIERLSKLNQNFVDKVLNMKKRGLGSNERYRFEVYEIEKLSELNQDIVDKFITMTKYPDGSGDYRFDVYDIERLSELDQAFVDKVLNMKEKGYDGNERYRFDYYDLEKLSELDRGIVDKFLNMTNNPDGTGGYRFNAYDIEKLSELDQNTVMKYVNMTDNGRPRFNADEISTLMNDESDAGIYARNLAGKVNESKEYLYDFNAITFLKDMYTNKQNLDIEKIISEQIGSDYKTGVFKFAEKIYGDDTHITLINKNSNFSYKFDLETMKLVSIEAKGELTYNLETGTTIGIKNNATRETAIPGKQTPVKREVYIKKSTGEELTEIMEESQIKGEYEIYQIGLDGRKNLIGLCEYDGNGGRHIEKNLRSLDGTKTDYVYADDVQGNRFLYYQITSPDGKKLFDTTKKHKVISDTHYQTFEDGKGYDIEIFDDKVVVTKLDENKQKTSEFIERKIIDLSEDDLDKLKSASNSMFDDSDNVYSVAAQYNGKWVDREMLPALKQLAGSEWFALDKNTSHILGTGAEQYNAFSDAIGDVSGMIAMSPETKSLLPVFEHELGHQKFHNLELFKDKELVEIYSREKELFTASFPDEHITSIDYFLAMNDFQSELSTRGMNETTAETNLLLNIPQSWDVIQDRTVILQQYFPNTIAKIGELLRKHETL